VELNARVSWEVTGRLEASLSGFNFLHAGHREYVFPGSDEFRRNFFLDTRWKL
jgi:hypothetical protein